MTQPSPLVGDDYFSARDKFLSEAEDCGAFSHSAALSEKGPGGRDLFIDVAQLGSQRARKVLVHLSGVHGVEGFIGSAIQSIALREGFVIPDDTALVLVHAVNPFGFAWLRRTNENNVDLNRNGLPSSEFPIRVKQSYSDYTKVSERLGIEQAVFDAQEYGDRLAHLVGDWGESKVKQALAGGQYAHPAGLFYGGTELQESYGLLKELLKEPLASADFACAIDVHTGLGPAAVDSLLAEYATDDVRFQWLSAAFPFRLSPMAPDEGVAYHVSGISFNWLEQEFPSASWWSVAQEFGTAPIPVVLGALIEENIWYHHRDPWDLDAKCKANLKEAFCPNDPTWQATVIDRGILAIFRALKQMQK